MILTEIAPAKINLALHIRCRRNDGYHDLETLFAFATYGDRLTVQAGEGLLLQISGSFGAGLSAGDDNLVLKAARQLKLKAGNPNLSALLHLEKNVPVASGIGGGSADAAAALRLLNRYWKLDWPIEQLALIARDLGADVSACLWSKPLAGYGRGDDLRVVSLPEITSLPLLLVNPDVAVETGPVFKQWNGQDRGGIGLEGEMSLAAIRSACRNDLEPGALQLCPIIGEVLEALIRTRPLLSRMSGSGATCFALYENTKACSDAARSIRDQYPGWWVIETRIGPA